MALIYLCLGSNLGDRKNNIEKAESLLAVEGIKTIKKSGLYESEPVGFKMQPYFYNLCVEAKTELEPAELLRILKEIEIKTGRQKGEKWGPRIIDIDILFYNNIILNTKELVIPHPEIKNRKFVLVPLSEIAENLVHPVYNISIKELLKNCSFKENIKRLET